MSARITAAALAAAALLLVPTAAAAGTPSTAQATFVAGETDGARAVTGTVKFTQAASRAPITAVGQLSGLAANQAYVTVPYKDGVCLPAVGVTAFPSGSFTTDGNGDVSFSVTVNPTSLNPLGVFDVSQTRSVSVRQVVLSPVNVGGIVGTPTVPNGAQTEACDPNPVTS